MSGNAFPAAFQGIPISLRGGQGSEWLYRLFGEEGLMYVGITRIGVQRFKGHQKDKAWWPHVQRIEVECFETRAEVRVAECEAIDAEQPTFNVADRGAYAAQAARESEQRRELLVQLGVARRQVDRFAAENRELRQALTYATGECHEEELPDNVIALVPSRLRKSVVA